MQPRLLLGLALGLVVACSFTQDFQTAAGPSAPSDGGDAGETPVPASELPSSDAGACEDTQADANNCGQCGHSCLGGACRAGLCQPVVLASGLGDSSGVGGAADATSAPGPSSIVADATSAYWANGIDTLMRVPLAGGKAEHLATLPLGFNPQLVLTSDAVFAVSPFGSALTRVDKKTGALTTVVDSAYAVRAFAIVGADVFFWSSRGKGAIYRCALPACPTPMPSPVYTQTESATNPGAQLDGVAASSTWLFVSTTSTLRSVLEKRKRDTGELVANIGQGAQRYASPVVDGPNVYASNYRYIVSAPVDPNPDTSVTFDKYIVSGEDVRILGYYTFDADFFYWAEGWGPRRVVRCAKEGCAHPEPLWVSAAGAAPTDWWGRAGAPDGAIHLGANDDALVFTTGDGKVMKLAKPPSKKPTPRAR